jgi:hypothetical protein
LNKGETVQQPGLLDPITAPRGAWETISMDFGTKLPKVDGKEGILVIIDKFTKYDHFIPISLPYTTPIVAQLFFEHVYKLHGVPTKLISNRDPVFTSLFWKELMKHLCAALAGYRQIVHTSVLFPD